MRIKICDMTESGSEGGSEGGTGFPVNCRTELNVAGFYGIPVQINGEITQKDNKYMLKAQLKAILALRCDLCLEPFEYTLITDLLEAYVKSGCHERDERSIEKGIIDITEAAEDAIIMNLPMKAVCRSECKGLCPVCGHNLNDGGCGCDRSYIDPRFEMLRGFID